jgi:hypothetical protein
MPRARGSLVEVLATAGTRGATVRVGVLADIAGGAPWVEFPGSGGPVRARSMVPLEPAAVAGGARPEVVLLFEEGDAARPIVAGLLEPEVATPALDAVLADRETARRAGLPEIAEVDGERVVLEGKEEVVLRCGDASITLRRDGRIVVRGQYVETHAAGTNRIKGATVKIN